MCPTTAAAHIIIGAQDQSSGWMSTSTLPTQTFPSRRRNIAVQMQSLYGQHHGNDLMQLDKGMVSLVLEQCGRPAPGTPAIFPWLIQRRAQIFVRQLSGIVSCDSAVIRIELESCDANGLRNVKNTNLAKQRPVFFPHFSLSVVRNRSLKLPKEGAREGGRTL